MKITYISHSSFLVETKTTYLLFDYFQGSLPDLDQYKLLIVFASHHHGDHFSSDILSLSKKHKKIQYVLSNDIQQVHIPQSLQRKVRYMGEGETEVIENTEVRALKSTDEGVAYVVMSDGICIYHAGDLNNWTWEGESDEWNQNMQDNYRNELKKIKDLKVHVAFVPLDPRLGQWYYLGVDDFMRIVDADILFPMHFWGDYSVISNLKNSPCARDYKEKIVELHWEGECFII